METPLKLDAHSAMLQRYVKYNLWANQQMVNWLEQASEEQLEQSIDSSFPSLKETLKHLWLAEHVWLQTILNETVEPIPAKDFKGTKHELFQSWLETSKAFDKQVSAMSLEDLQSMGERRGRQIAYADMIQHCMNHATYHRGQLVTMGRQLGLTLPPRTDFIYYIGI